MTAPFPDARVLLKRYGLAAKKSWGQNFLVAERAFRAIVDATVGADDDWVVEIGAGLGTLTMRLAERLPEGKVIAVEREPDMIRVLEAELAHLDTVEVVPANALSYDFATVARWRGERITVCGNLPYQIASQILFRVLDAREHVGRGVFMLQREMADRILAGPGSRTYGVLSVMIQAYAAVSPVIRVKATGFVPPPKVESAVIRLDIEPSARVPITDHAAFSRVVHAAFETRRKTLRNALRARYDVEGVDAALAATNIDGVRRAETLSPAEFARLTAAMDGVPPLRADA